MRTRAAIFTTTIFIAFCCWEAAGEEEGSSTKEAADGLEESKEKAKMLFMEGIEAFAAENYPDALSAFMASYELNPNPNVLYNIGMCQRALYDFMASISTLEKYLDKKGNDISKQEKTDIENVITEMEASLAKLDLSTSEKGVTIIVDGKEVGTTPLPSPLLLNAGDHIIEVKKEGFKNEKESISLKSGQHETMQFTLVPVVEAAPPDKVLEADKDAVRADEKKRKKKKWYKSPLLWSLIGVALVGGGTAAGVITWKARSGKNSMGDGDWIIHGK